MKINNEESITIKLDKREIEEICFRHVLEHLNAKNMIHTNITGSLLSHKILDVVMVPEYDPIEYKIILIKNK